MARAGQPSHGASAMTKNVTRFDESLPVFVAALAAVLSADVLTKGTFLRNANGQLAFIGLDSLPDDLIARAHAAAGVAVGAYARPRASVLPSDYPGVSMAQGGGRKYTEVVRLPNTETLTIRVVEQRIVGQDWLRAPIAQTQHSGPERHVFFSIKGGVGRSTALAVTAADLAHQGRKVLVIDLDLEAPGIGQMLLPNEELPRFGMLDAYVEGNFGVIDESFLIEMISASPFGRGRGLIDVVPAVGSTAQAYPGNVLAKIARAYLDNTSDSGEIRTFLDRTHQLVDQLATTKQYDAVLLDARAGLNESTAAALLGLGAQVFMFGENTPQTFAGYRYLLAHLSRFERDPNDDWLDRVRMIHAKASAEAAQQQAFRDRAHAVFMEWLYRDTPLDASNPETVVLPEFSVDDTEAPHFAWPVLRDSNYFEFDPLAKPSELTPALYERTYGALLAKFDPLRDAEDL